MDQKVQKEHDSSVAGPQGISRTTMVLKVPKGTVMDLQGEKGANGGPGSQGVAGPEGEKGTKWR